MITSSTNLDSIKNWAEHYENLGCKLVALKPESKKPKIVPGFGAFGPVPPAQFQDTWGIGVNLGQSRLCSLDVDHPEGFETISKACKWPSLSKYNGITGKGRRYIFRLPEGAQYAHKKLSWDNVPVVDKLTGELKAKPQVILELRACTPDRNMQDCLPPTIHPDTKKPYSWDRELTDIPELPAWLQDLFLNWEDYEDELKALNPYQTPEPDEMPVKVQVDVCNAPSSNPLNGNSNKAVIEAYNRAHRIESVLIQHGYKHRRGNEYVSPHSTTAKDGGGGVTVFPDDNKCNIHSMSDPLHDDKAPRSPFDFLYHYTHERDFKGAIKAAAKQLGMDYASQRAAVSDFSYIPTLEPGNDTAAADKPMKGPKPSLFVKLGELEVKPTDWLIKGTLESNSMTVLYGQPGHGKSFIAIDWACSIATGRDWMGGAIKKPGAVFYLAGEGLNGIAKRFKAWGIENNLNLNDYPIYPSKSGTDLHDTNKAVELINDIRSSCEVPALIVIDTMARNFLGDENSAKDVGQFITNVDLIRNAFGCGVLIVHHCGKDQERGARGSTALKGAADAEYGCKKTDDGVITLKSSKMKDAEPPKDKHMKLQGVELNLFDEDEEAVTSAVVVQVDDSEVTPPTSEQRSQHKAARLWNGSGKKVFIDSVFNEDEGCSEEVRYPYVTRSDLEEFYRRENPKIKPQTLRKKLKPYEVLKDYDITHDQQLGYFLFKNRTRELLLLGENGSDSKVQVEGFIGGL